MITVFDMASGQDEKVIGEPVFVAQATEQARQRQELQLRLLTLDEAMAAEQRSDRLGR
ncbi:hypothetical protein [Chitinimonas sp. JJ19]|uniref:hypothetical protein n=1 Tax=Chitinimonas sp. JJ19 TaxID=3109352 RepID=UPI001A41817A|nr:hypothetical protein [Chitinimonas sp.]